MNDGVKYLVRSDLGLILEMPAALIEILRPQLDSAGIPYQVLDSPPNEEGTTTGRRRGT
jgi:hypothetical protein